VNSLGYCDLSVYKNYMIVSIFFIKVHYVGLQLYMIYH